jgi:hypothetical protein
LKTLHDFDFDEGSELLDVEQDAQETDDDSLFASMPEETHE